MAQSKVTLLIETKLEKFEELQRAGEKLQTALGVGTIAAEYQALDKALGSILDKIKAINTESGKSGVLGSGGLQPIGAAHGGAGATSQARSAVAEQIASTGPVSAAQTTAAGAGFSRVNLGFSMGHTDYTAPEARGPHQFPVGTVVPDRLLPPGHPSTPVPAPILDPADKFLGYHPSAAVAQSTVSQQIEKAAPKAKTRGVLGGGATGRWAGEDAPIPFLPGAAPNVGARAAFPVTPTPPTPDVGPMGYGAFRADGIPLSLGRLAGAQLAQASRQRNAEQRRAAASAAREAAKEVKQAARGGVAPVEYLARGVAGAPSLDADAFDYGIRPGGIVEPDEYKARVAENRARISGAANYDVRRNRPMSAAEHRRRQREYEEALGVHPEDRGLARRRRLFGAVGGLGIPGVSPWAQRQAAPPGGGGGGGGAGGAGGAGGEGGDGGWGYLGALGAIPRGMSPSMMAGGALAFGATQAANLGWEYYTGRRLGALGGVGGAQQLAAADYAGRWGLYGGMAGSALGAAGFATSYFSGPVGVAVGVGGMLLGAAAGRKYGEYVGGVGGQVAQSGALGREFQTEAQGLALTGAGGGGIGGLIGSGEYFQPPQTSPGAAGMRPASQALGYTMNQQMAMGVQTFGAAWAAPRELDDRRQKTIMQMTRFGVAPKVTGQMLFNLSRSAKTIRMTGPHGTVSQRSTAWGRGGRDWLTPVAQGLFTEGLGFEEQRQMYGMAGRMMGEGFLRTGIQGGATMGNIQQFVGGGTGPGGQGPSLAQQGGGMRAMQFAEGMVGYGRGLARSGPQSPFDFALISTLTGGGGVSPQSLADAYKALEKGDILSPGSPYNKKFVKYISSLQNYGGDPAFGEMMLQRALQPAFGGQLGLSGTKKIAEMVVAGKGADVVRKEFRRIQGHEGLGGLAGDVVTPEMKDTARIQDEMTGIGNEMIKTMIIFEEAAKDMTIQLKKLGPEMAQLAKQMATASGGN